MKTYKQFCVDANIIQENWFKNRINDASRAVSGVVRNVTNTFSRPKPPVAKPKPQQPVLAYYKHQQGFGTGANWKPGKWTPEQEKRYGWKPVRASVYTPGDRFTPNKVTATGDPHNWTTRNAAVPFKYPEGRAPKGKEGEPSIPYGSRLKVTAAPMGTAPGATKDTIAKINDVGDFGRNRQGQVTGHVNPHVKYDVSPQIVSDIYGKPPSLKLAKQHGTGYVYTQLKPPPTSVAKPKPKRKK